MKTRSSAYGWKYPLKQALSLILFIFICLALSGCFSETRPTLEYGAEGSDLSFLVISDGNRFGYIDPSGNVVIKPRFSEAHPFFEGLAQVKLNGKYGYIDQSGKTVIPFRYEAASEFRNGKAIVSTDVQSIGEYTNLYQSYVIDTNGGIVHELGDIYDYSYSAGFYFIKAGNTYTTYDRDFNVIKTPFDLYDYGITFNEGYGVVAMDGKYRYITSPSGEQPFPNGFYDARGFSDGLAAVRLDDLYDPFGYIDRTGKMAIAPQFQHACPFGEGKACVVNADGRTVVIESSGNDIGLVQCPDCYRRVEGSGSFSDGLCVVRAYLTGGIYNYGYIDATGNWVIVAKFYEATPFKNGIAEVQVDDKIAYIDKTGKYIWGPK